SDSARQKCCKRARGLRDGNMLQELSYKRQSQDGPVKYQSPRRCAKPEDERGYSYDHERKKPPEVCAHPARDSRHDQCEHGQLVSSKAFKEIRHARHYIDGQKRNHAERCNQEQRRVSERAANLSSKANASAHVVDVTVQHIVQRAASLSGKY